MPTAEIMAQAKEKGIAKCSLRLLKVDKKARQEFKRERIKIVRARTTRKIRERQAHLRELGLKTKYMTKGSKLTVTEKQKIAIALLCDFEHNWPIEYIAEKADCKPNTIHRWKNDPIFIKEMNVEITRRITQFRREAMKHVFNRVKRGDIRTIFKYLQMTGDMAENLNINQSDGADAQTADQVQAEIDRLTDELGSQLKPKK